MSIDAELLLPSDVEIFSVLKLSPSVRTNLDAGDDDYAVTRRRSRAPSRIIDKQTADLLGAFRIPTRIVDAVLSFAGKRGLDPELTLEQAYPLLYHLYEMNVLVPPERANGIEGELEVGSSVAGFRLLRCLQVLEDNEVFLARSAAGNYAAVKFYRKPAQHTTAALEREAEMLRRAPSTRAPNLYFLERCGSGISLGTEWIFGSDAAMAAAGFRRRGIRTQASLLGLCAEIATAFADLHEAGILHGDIHPRNVLVDGGGAVRVIDFGLAQAIDGSAASNSRGGVAFYFDPEFADAQRNHTHAKLTPEAEQYSLASLLYQLWTGVYYLDWSLERDELLRQIVEDEPLGFEARSVPAWPSLEALLRRALDKKPERRFPSMRAFADTLRELMPEAEARDKRAHSHHKERARENELLERMLRRYAIGANGFEESIARAPFASLNTGVTGVAYALYRVAQLRGDPQLLSAADVWTQKAYELSKLEKAFYEPDLELTPETIGEVSLFHSMSGVHWVRALISGAMGDAGGARRAVEAFVAHSRGPCDKPDLTLGRAGLLLGCCELLEAFPTPWYLDLQAVRERGDELAAETAALLENADMANSTRVKSLGIAHGWAGLIYALLRWAKAREMKPHPLIEPALDELTSLGEPHGSGLRWPMHNSTSTPTYMEGWCNGTAGYALLFLLAHDALGIGRFGETAQRAALSAWSAEMEVGSLCCGLGGIAYALLGMYRLTRSDFWLERARLAVRSAAADGSKHFLREALYKGAVGVAVLAEDLKHPEHAAMPAFEPLR